jgi:phospholipase D-like protein
MTRPHFRDLSNRQQFVLLTAASVQLALAATAWADLTFRAPEEVNGSKRVWAAVIAVNFVGPACYFRWGRRALRAD